MRAGIAYGDVNNNDEDAFVDPLTKEIEVEPQFSQPVRQITSMMVALGLVGAGLYIGFAQLDAIFWSNPYLNGAILIVFVLGVLSCFGQVAQLMRSVQWIEGFAKQRLGYEEDKAPGLLAPLATLLRSRGARMQISSSSSRSILESVAQRIDEDREITRYIGNTLIFLGLLGTFYGLATTVPALVETIRSLNPAEGEDGADIFGRLQQGLESQLGGMGTAFSSSLLGLAGSLVVGLLELFASHGQNRFYRELEEWLSTITRLGFASGDEGGGETSMLSGFLDHMAQQMDAQHNALDADPSGSGGVERAFGGIDRGASRAAVDRGRRTHCLQKWPMGKSGCWANCRIAALTGLMPRAGCACGQSMCKCCGYWKRCLLVAKKRLLICAAISRV